MKQTALSELIHEEKIRIAIYTVETWKFNPPSKPPFPFRCIPLKMHCFQSFTVRDATFWSHINHCRFKFFNFRLTFTVNRPFWRVVSVKIQNVFPCGGFRHVCWRLESLAPVWETWQVYNPGQNCWHIPPPPIQCWSTLSSGRNSLVGLLIAERTLNPGGGGWEKHRFGIVWR